MDSGFIINGFISGTWYILPLLIIVIFIKTPKFKGWLGESVVNVLTWLLLDKKARKQ